MPYLTKLAVPGDPGIGSFARTDTDSLLQDGRNVQGPRGAGNFLDKLAGAIESWVGTEWYIDDEEEGYLVAALHTLGRVRDTGREFDVPEAHLWMVKEGRVVWFKAYIASR